MSEAAPSGAGEQPSSLVIDMPIDTTEHSPKVDAKGKRKEQTEETFPFPHKRAMLSVGLAGAGDQPGEASATAPALTLTQRAGCFDGVTCVLFGQGE